MAKPDPLPLYVAVTESGAEVRSRVDESVVGHESLRAALDSLLKHEAFQPNRQPLFEESVWRWLDATAEEPDPAFDGTQVTKGAIATMAARLNAQASPIMIDGGSTDSAAHESMRKSDTPANGWAHVGAEVLDASGRWHLYLHAEVLPEVAKAQDENRLAFGSIGFLQNTSDLSDATLLQHALTNIPAVDGLTPAGSVRAVRSTRTRRMTAMARTTTSKRGPAMDAMAELYAKFKIDPTQEDAHWKLVDAIHALSTAAAGESAIEAVTGTPAAAAKSAARAIDGLEGADLEAAVTKFLDAARKALGMPEGTLADLATALDSNAEKISAALVEEPEETPAEGAADATTETKAAEKSAAGDALNARLSKLESELTAHKQSIAARDARDARRARVESAFESIGLSLKVEERDRIADALSAADEKVAERYLALEIESARSKTPPSGRVLAGRAKPGDSDEPGESITERARLIADEEKKVLAETPGLTSHRAFREAQRRVAKRHPELFLTPEGQPV